MRWLIFYCLLFGYNIAAQKQPCEEKLWKITLPNFPAPQYTEEWQYQIYAQPNYNFIDFPYSSFNVFDSVAITIVLNELDTLYFPKILYDRDSYWTDTPPYLYSALQVYIPKNQPNKAVVIQKFAGNRQRKVDTLQLKQKIGDALRLKIWINQQATLCRTFTEQKQIRLYPIDMTNAKNDDSYSFCGYMSLETPCLDLEVELAYKKEYEAHMDTFPDKPLTKNCQKISYDVIIETP